MTVEKFSRKAGTGLTPRELAMLEEAEKRPQIFDDDCPKLTAEQLAEFQPVHFDSREERAQAMNRASGKMRKW
ncbi:MAG: hypothetical protein LBN21_00280 [Treponema sp.]|nr:hypothetical protein [Treponema sp.]